jgi:hypothetical protein
MPKLSFVSFVSCAVASTGLVLGCYATVSPEPAPVVATGPGPAVVYDDEVVDAPPPPQIETYPTVVYAGAPHYYVEGRWYRQTPRGWGYYKREPAHLRDRHPPPRERREEPRHEERR